MKKLNNKGFSLVELLAVITILGILSGTAILAYSRYKEKARIQAYDTMAESAMHAMEEYIMDNPDTTGPVTLDTLYQGQYLERPVDPGTSETECTGNVIPEAVSGNKELDTYNYTINICCTNYSYQYSYSHDSGTMNKKQFDAACSN